MIETSCVVFKFYMAIVIACTSLMLYNAVCFESSPHFSAVVSDLTLINGNSQESQNSNLKEIMKNQGHLQFGETMVVSPRNLNCLVQGKIAYASVETDQTWLSFKYYTQTVMRQCEAELTRTWVRPTPQLVVECGYLLGCSFNFTAIFQCDYRYPNWETFEQYYRLCMKQIDFRNYTLPTIATHRFYDSIDAL